MRSADTASASPKPRKRFYQELLFWVLVAVAAAVAFGVLAPGTAQSLQPLGTVFISAISMIVGPIVFCLVVTGIGGVADLKVAGRIGLRSLIYFEAVTTIALIIGLVVMNVVKPGQGMNIDLKAISVDPQVAGYIDAGEHKDWWEILTGVVPKSVVAPFVEGDILQILFVAVLFAVALRMVGAPARPIVSGVEAVGQVLFKVLRIVMYAAPVGVFGALTAIVGTFGPGKLAGLGEFIGLYWLTAALFIVVVLGGVMRMIGLNIFKLLRYIRSEILVVLGTSSSEVVLPQILRKLENLGSPREVNGLTVPTGYSFNQDGTSIYYTFCSLFIAQAAGVHLGLWQQIGLVAILMLTSKGVAAVTGAGFIVLAATLSAVGTVPVAGIMLIFGINRFLSDGAAITNLCGNTVAGLVVSRWEGVLDLDRARAVLDRRPVPPLPADAPEPTTTEPPTGETADEKTTKVTHS
ncbi:cation:dicarboxylase symporter family transporter [Streptomyces sp. NPDC005962]|uniref:cation:dicarboxylate symporter family transporter n=1 Tax=Streptomyces sp. NPDC005962 TaxID=3154466 RepID=UPI0033D73C1A